MQALRFEQIVLLYFHLNLHSNLHLFTFIESECYISEHKCDYEFKIIGLVISSRSSLKAHWDILLL